jgi:hypothetical protein
MRTSGGVMPYLLGGVALGAGAAWLLRKRAPSPLPEPKGEWTLGMRLATGAIGGGLMMYGNRATGKTARLAAVTGMGLVTRSILDQPVRGWQDVIKPRTLLAL